MKRILIVGGGIAGLSLAYECLVRGFDVLIVEKDSSVGGLSKSITHNGCRLDIGVHIMHLRDREVFQKIQEIVDHDQWVKIKRNGKLYLKGRYIDWPLRLSAIYQLPIRFSFKIFLDQISKKKRDSDGSGNFRDELLSLYGPSLYYSFFHPLTEKFLKTDPKFVHSDWAFSSIRAATKIEDRSFSESHKYLTESTDAEAKKDFNIVKFVFQSLKANREDEAFYYFKDGFGVLPESYEKKIIAGGGKILLGSQVDSFVMEGSRIKQAIIGGNSYDVDQVVWTGDPYEMCDLLAVECPPLKFLNSKFVFFFLKSCKKDHQVCYYADSDVSFVRGTILSNHSRTIIKNKDVSDLFCLEYTFKSPQEMTGNLDAIKKIAIEDLKKVKIIDDESAVESVFELNVPSSYPILTVDYRGKLADLQNKINGFDNVWTFGRQATFNYENADIIIKQAIRHPILDS